MNMQSKKNIKSCFLILTLFSSLLAEWKLDQFITGVWVDPDILGYNEKLDNVVIKKVSEANINLLSGVASTWYSTYFTFNTQNAHVSFINYRLNLLAKFNRSRGKVLLRTFVMDSRWSYYLDPSSNSFIMSTAEPSNLYDYTTLPDSLREALFGYSLGDEPDVALLNAKTNQLDAFKRLDPDKPAYMNLFSNRVMVNSFHNDTSGYRNYVKLLADHSSILSFDNYPFIKDSYNLYMRDEYFRNYQVFAEESRLAGKPFFAHPMSIQSYSAKDDLSVNPNELDGPPDARISLTDGKLRFMAFVPVIYGAKGIIWYTYGLPSSKAESYVYGEGMLMPNSYDTVVNDTIYNRVKNINGELLNMGDVLLGLKWIRTVHGNSKNNMGYARIKSFQSATNASKIHKRIDGSIVGLDSLENNLPTFANETDVIASDFEDMFAVGIMKGQGNVNPYYLLVMNKDVDSSQTINLTLRNKYNIYRHKKTTKDWEKLSSLTNQIQLRIAPGDMQMIRLSKPDIGPVLNLLLD